MEELLRGIEITKSKEGKPLLDNVSFEVYPGDCIGLIGPNGCGKTTLFRMILGEEGMALGELRLREDLRIRYLEQDQPRFQEATVSQFFARPPPQPAVLMRMNELESKLGDPNIYDDGRFEAISSELARLKNAVNQSKGASLFGSAGVVLKELGLERLTGEEMVGTMSGGERQKLCLAKLFVRPQECDLMLLDEPTNHLDIDTIEWLENKVADFPGALMVISHDKYLLENLVDRVFEMINLKMDQYDGTFEEYEEQRKFRQHAKEQAYKRTEANIRRQKAIIQKLTRRNKYDSQIATKVRRLEKLERVENPIIKQYILRFRFKEVFKSGRNVADGAGLSKAFGEKVILDDATFEIYHGEKTGLIGPNGCGKTTFLKMLLGSQRPDEGKICISQGVKAGYFDQGHLSLVLENTLLEEVMRDREGMTEPDAKALLGQFNFKGVIVNNRVDEVSGGERARLAFLRLLLEPYNFLILDEPTNHMDWDSKQAIATALNSYNGTALIASHDRHFLDMTTDHTLLMSGGKIKSYHGNYTLSKVQRDKESEYQRPDPLYAYVVKKSFTEWVQRVKHQVGEEVEVNEYNFERYKWAVDNGFLVKRRKN